MNLPNQHAPFGVAQGANINKMAEPAEAIGWHGHFGKLKELMGEQNSSIAITFFVQSKPANIFTAPDRGHVHPMDGNA